MKRLIYCLALGILFSFMTSSYTLAMMGGGHGGGSGMGGGHMGGGMGYGVPYERQAPYSDSRQQNYDRQQPRYNREPMDRNTAEGLAQNYLMGRYGDAYRLGELKDHDTYYTAEIHGRSGELTDRILIDKQSGNIHSLR